MQGSVRAIALTMVRADGSTLPVLVNARLHSDESGRALAIRVTVFDASDRKTYETELLEARRRAERLAGRLRLVERVVADLARSAWVDDVLTVVAGAGVSAFGARTSGVWLVDESTGGLTGLVSAGAGAAAAGTVEIPRAARTAYGDELRSGDAVVLPPGTARRAYPQISAALGATGDDSLALVPLSVRGRLSGVLALRFGHGDPVDDTDRGLLETLGRQAGEAVQRARLSEQQRSVAVTLQRSLLPTELPTDPRIAIATTYRPAEAELEVGGDWYDAFRLDADRVALVVGDVVGRGVDAAAAMGQLRSAIRALAAVDAGPSVLIGRLDSFVDGVRGAQTATLAYAEVDLRDGSVRYACAGHPPPVALDGAGGARLLWEGRSPPLGAHFGALPRPEGKHVLPPGGRMVLYTDGLVERRDRPLDESIDGLVLDLATWAAAPASQITEGIVEVMLRDEDSRDDVCVLAVVFG
jgi:hypothetical protein